FAVGYATPDEVAEVLELLWGGPETLIVISSDLSHYHPYADAQRRDRHTADEITHLRLLLDHEQACGATPINGLIEIAQRRGLQPHLLDLRNSGDTAGDKSRVVGYASFAFMEHGDG
ncbi:MAG: AmmeMemoRadiSam system protein B, partial [Rhodocyclaceae bacterium]|nr:AmmeMemoRadiSam system protein B [Rhodocyclaceae bacterium]